MTLYETTFIINPQTDDATIDLQVRQVAELIDENKGKVRFEDHMGTRRLAYEIKGLTQGYYASFIFEAPTKLLPVLERHYKLNESYVRHLTVRFEGDLEKMMGQVEREAPAAEKPEAAPPAPAETAPAETAPVEEAAAEETAKVETVEPEEVKPVEEPAEASAPEPAVESEEEKPAEETNPEDEEL